MRGWLGGYRLPAENDPLRGVEQANLEILRFFFAVLAVAAAPGYPTALQALRQHLPGGPEFPLFGAPSLALQALGVARGTGAVAELQDRLLDEFSGEQRALVMVASGQS